MRRSFLLLAAMSAVLVATAVGSTALTASGAGSAQNYLVIYKSENVPANAAKAIQQAGGTLVYSYGQIGVALASSSNASFTSNLLKADKSVDTAAATSGFATKLEDAQAGGPPVANPDAPVSGNDSLSGLQWDMDQIHAPEAHAITGGSTTVLVGDIDTGLDYTHPDLAPNVDAAASANCVSGVPGPGAVAANDDNGHGTHTAGTIAAAANGIGIVGVAPNVRIAGIKAGNAAGYFFPEAVVCSFIWAGTHGVDITNNSYFADPWLFNCKNDPAQRAIWQAEQRAIRFAQQNGVTVVAAEGNQSDDLSHPSEDDTSPDDTTPTENRPVTNACVVVPTELPGVIGVTADGNRQQANGGYLKSFYSSFGISTADVIAPGGDSLLRHHGRCPQRARALDVARVAAHGHMPPGETAGRRQRRDILLPAGDVDGLTARGRRCGAHRQSLREDVAGAARRVPRADSRSAALSERAAGRLCSIRRSRRPAGSDLPGRIGPELVVRSRPGERPQRDHPRHERQVVGGRRALVPTARGSAGPSRRRSRVGRISVRELRGAPAHRADRLADVEDLLLDLAGAREVRGLQVFLQCSLAEPEQQLGADVRVDRPPRRPARRAPRAGRRRFRRVARRRRGARAACGAPRRGSAPA